MWRRCRPLLPIISFWFGLGVLLAMVCSLELALFIAVVLLLIMAFNFLRFM